MSAKAEIGRSYKRQTRVEEWMTAEKAGNPGVDVLSTPILVGFIEEAAIHCLAPTLEAGEVTLGTHLEVAHIAPTPVGMIVRVEVEIVSIDRRRVTFAVGAFDEREKIAEGTHERYIADRAIFIRGLEEKLS
jgi:fluoroacetyl-CoA thioesterase